jgi:hypothetical protein
MYVNRRTFEHRTLNMMQPGKHGFLYHIACSGQIKHCIICTFCICISNVKKLIAQGISQNRFVFLLSVADVVSFVQQSPCGFVWVHFLVFHCSKLHASNYLYLSLHCWISITFLLIVPA